MFKRSKRSKLEEANILLGEAKVLGQQRKYQEATETIEKAIALFTQENDRQKLDLSKALFYEFKAEQSIKSNRALEASNYLGRAGGFYMRLHMVNDLNRVYKKQADILLILARQTMKEKHFIEAASYFEQAAMAYQKLKNKEMELDCKAKSYVSRAAAEKTISGRKVYLRKAVEIMQETGTDNPIIKGHLAYYNGLFIKEEKKEEALRYFSEALQNYQKAGMSKRVEEIKKMINDLVSSQI
ncbi:MAG: hypothetical protein K9W45_10465 [Candidatus Heimdallarchaeum aukensis]|uniref:Uncharacterized protein n=1 Tax=Candidatus Heimdallarchaeum aukensis TaxID=2876573 RepID=A0A9Y1BL42_9ARCH|nr:MAG: hypothetical protein K9W45_10465 [Candidatus Heimdallarchaeum aukensis]